MIMQGISAVLLNPSAVMWVFVGTLVGILFGCIPGLTATMAIAMFLPMTYGMAATEGQATLMALYIGGISGGLISAILLNIPGTPASMATCLDGTPLARKGQAGKALGVGIVFSFMGTILSLLALVGISPALANIAIKFGPWEYFSITVFSLTLIITLSEENLVKGLITGIIGLMLATVGLAPIDSVSRYTFGSNALNGGFDILTVLVGVFAISEILLAAENSHKPSASQKATVITDFNIKGFGFSLKEFFSQIPNCIRSALIGIGLGILPGIGSGTSNMLSYTIAKNQSKHPEKFGTGIIDGVVASETANNATIGGTWYVVFGSSLAMLVSAVVNSTLNQSLGRMLKKNNFASFAFRSYVSTGVGQFIDNLVFAIVVSHTFFGWTWVQVLMCSLTGAVAELLCEVFLSPVGYKVVRGWERENVGAEYLERHATA